LLDINGILLSLVFLPGTERIMHNINKIKNKAKVTTTLLSLATILVVAGVSTSLTATTTSLSQSASAQRFIDQESNFAVEPKAPMAVSSDGNNVYIVWWTNKSENWEVMFRASNDGGQTFDDKINLSNSSDAESQNAEIVAAGEDSVFVSWWETSPETGSSESVLRVSNDAGQTFGPVIMPSMNGTISSTATGNTVTTTVTEGGAGGEQQQCQLDIITNEETFEVGEPVTITVTNSGDEALEFPNSMLGLEIKNRDTGETYPLFSAQVITTLEPRESRTFEFSYEELVSEIGTGTIDTSVSSSGNECSASTAFTLAAGSEPNSLTANSTNANSTNT
jgi:hypothetical protein